MYSLVEGEVCDVDCVGGMFFERRRTYLPILLSLAHVQRELQGLVENGSAWAKLYAAPQPLSKEAHGRVCRRYRRILSQAELGESPPESKVGRGRPKSTPGRICFVV